MSYADQLFNDLVSRIITQGDWDEPEDVRAKWEDGTPAHSISLLGETLKFDNIEVPILTTKQVFWKNAIKELLWIWQMKSNVVQDLRDMGVNIWDKWEIKEGKWEGTIGPAYGYQLGKKCILENGEMLDQVDYLLHMLKHSPGSRRIITTLWVPEDMKEMALTPCVWKTWWIRKAGKLHLIVGIRSNDLCVGNPFNVFQYYVLQRMVCQVTGIPIGSLTFNIDDAHVYDRHIETVKKQIKESMHIAPTLWINPEVKNFYDFTIDDFKLENYQYSGKYQYEVAE